MKYAGNIKLILEQVDFERNIWFPLNWLKNDKRKLPIPKGVGFAVSE
jgi:hypothetical protein